MARYIDADALVQDLKEQYEDVFGKIKKEVRPEDFYIERNHAYYASLVDKELNILFDYLKEIPTADVAEVVRCKDCVMHEKGCPLDTHPYMTPDDGYCYKGKRKDGE